MLAETSPVLISDQKVVVVNPLNIDYYKVKKAALIIRALNHKLRQQIIKVIDDAQRITVTDIYVKLRLVQSVASQHLAILRKAGVVSIERDGKFIYYIINQERVADIELFVTNLLD